MVPEWKKSFKRKTLSAAKFYYFDLGVRNTLAGIKVIVKKSDIYGQLFEHFIATVLK